LIIDDYWIPMYGACMRIDLANERYSPSSLHGQPNPTKLYVKRVLFCILHLIIDDYWIPIQLYWNPMYGACMRNNHPSI
jgi:hypothetical protein